MGSFQKEDNEDNEDNEENVARIKSSKIYRELKYFDQTFRIQYVEEATHEENNDEGFGGYETSDDAADVDKICIFTLIFNFVSLFLLQ